jgi:hypothetical protein
MIDGDRVCCSMFDEMSIRENLHFCEKFGCAEVIEDLRKHDRTSIVGNHALVFIGCIVLITDKMQTFIRQ